MFSCSIRKRRRWINSRGLTTFYLYLLFIHLYIALSHYLICLPNKFDNHREIALPKQYIVKWCKGLTFFLSLHPQVAFGIWRVAFLTGGHCSYENTWKQFAWCLKWDMYTYFKMFLLSTTTTVGYISDSYFNLPTFNINKINQRMASRLYLRHGAILFDILMEERLLAVCCLIW